MSFVLPSFPKTVGTLHSAGVFGHHRALWGLWRIWAHPRPSGARTMASKFQGSLVGVGTLQPPASLYPMLHPSEMVPLLPPVLAVFEPLAGDLGSQTQPISLLSPIKKLPSPLHLCPLPQGSVSHPPTLILPLVETLSNSALVRADGSGAAAQPESVELQLVAPAEDDFFSLAYNFAIAPSPEPSRKKRKKKKKAVLCEDSVPSALSQPQGEGAPDVLLQRGRGAGSAPQDRRSLTPPPAQFTYDPSAPNGARRSLTPPPVQFTYDPSALNGDRRSLTPSRPHPAPIAVEPSSPAAVEEIAWAIPIDSTVDREAEKKREYLVSLTSKLPGSLELNIKMRIKGLTRFSKVVQTALDGFVKFAPNEIKGLYLPALVSLIWIERKMPIKPRMKPATLSISPDTPLPHLSFLLIEAGMLPRFKEFPEIASKLKRARLLSVDDLDDEPFAVFSQGGAVALGSSGEELAEEAPVSVGLASLSPPALGIAGGLPDAGPAGANDGYFPVVLRAQDGVTIKVKVNAATRIGKLAAYYLQCRNLPASTAVQLVFDNEPLGMDDAVGDTELEEDFTVDVVYI